MRSLGEQLRLGLSSKNLRSRGKVYLPRDSSLFYNAKAAETLGRRSQRREDERVAIQKANERADGGTHKWVRQPTTASQYHRDKCALCDAVRVYSWTPGWPGSYDYYSPPECPGATS